MGLTPSGSESKRISTIGRTEPRSHSEYRDREFPPRQKFLNESRLAIIVQQPQNPLFHFLPRLDERVVADADARTSYSGFTIRG